MLLIADCQCHGRRFCRGYCSSDLLASAFHTLLDTVTTPVIAAAMTIRTTTTPMTVTMAIATTVTTWLCCYWLNTVMLFRLTTTCITVVTQKITVFVMAVAQFVLTSAT